MQELLVLLCFALTSAEFVLRPRDPPQNIEKLEETPGQAIVIRCISLSEQKWVFNGGDLGQNHGVLTSEGADSVLTIESFDPKLHSGIYECYEGHLSASVRLESNVDPPLPKGFRPCVAEENNHCTKGSCGVDSNKKVACFCPPGWSGVKCDTVSDKVLQSPRDSNCWLSIGSVLFTIIVVGVAVIMVYFLCPIGKCRRLDSKKERCSSLLEKGETA